MSEALKLNIYDKEPRQHPYLSAQTQINDLVRNEGIANMISAILQCPFVEDAMDEVLDALSTYQTRGDVLNALAELYGINIEVFIEGEKGLERAKYEHLPIITVVF